MGVSKHKHNGRWGGGGIPQTKGQTCDFGNSLHIFSHPPVAQPPTQETSQGPFTPCVHVCKTRSRHTWQMMEAAPWWGKVTDVVAEAMCMAVHLTNLYPPNTHTHTTEGWGVGKHSMCSPQGGLSARNVMLKSVMLPRLGSDPASRHPGAQKPPLGRFPLPLVWGVHLDAHGHGGAWALGCQPGASGQQLVVALRSQWLPKVPNAPWAPRHPKENFVLHILLKPNPDPYAHPNLQPSPTPTPTPNQD